MGGGVLRVDEVDRGVFGVEEALDIVVKELVEDGVSLERRYMHGVCRR